MFESAELGHRISKQDYKQEVPQLREKLLDVQYDLLEKKNFSVLLLVGGVDCAGKGETVNVLNEWLDTRHLETHALRELTDEERERPPMFRFWRVLPSKGKISIFIGTWYSVPLLRNVYGEIGNAELDQYLDRNLRFEQMLCREGCLILKFWLHLSKKAQKERLKELESDPRTRWRVTKTDWQHYKLYDRFRQVSERMLRSTSTPEAPWTVVEGADPRYRYLTIGKMIHEALSRRLENDLILPASNSLPLMTTAIDDLRILQILDPNLALPKKEYRDQLAEWQGRLNRLSRADGFRNLSVVVVFEGYDAAGKGGSIRRIIQALDARFYRVVPVAAPTDEERARPYLWRFWRHLPRRGRFAIFDRSWYGRVLVERVENFCSQADWMRAYGEINDFEEQLIRHQTVVVKFWLSISKDEQLRRFEEREKVGFKRFKITGEDWRNRENWDAYEAAACDMIERTSTEIAPWTLVEANDKSYARIKVLKTLVCRIEDALNGKHAHQGR
ncbi:MAG: polyphosphate:AMP phosphotransferase [Syntrophotaleaceae bacterium]